MSIKLATLSVSTLICAGLVVSSLVEAAPRTTKNTNEPQLVNLDAKVNNRDNPVNLNLTKGTYEVKPVGKAAGGNFEGWSVWDKTNCTRAKGCPRLVPTRFTGMHNNYYVSSPNLTQAQVAGKDLPVVKEIPQYRDESYFLQNGGNRAYEVAEKYTYPDEASALAAAKSSTFTIDKDGTVSFILLDLSKSNDNRGGMALQVRKIN